MHLGRNVDGDINWFTDCGEPQTSFSMDMEVPFDTELKSTVLDGKYEVCGAGCRYNEGTAEQSKTMVWTDNGCIANGGNCSLFNRDPEDPPQELDSWEYITGPNAKMQKDWEYEYHCFCVK